MQIYVDEMILFPFFRTPLLFLLQSMHRFIQGQEGNWLKPNQFSVALHAHTHTHTHTHKLTHSLSLTLSHTHGQWSSRGLDQGHRQRSSSLSFDFFV